MKMQSMAKSFIIKAVVWLLVVHLPRLISATCYNSNGEVNADAVVCDSSKAVSVCCPKDFVCLANGLCQSTQANETTYGGFPPINYMYRRGVCTDKSWNSTSCPKYCTASSSDGFAMMGKCPNATDDRYFCVTSTTGRDFVGCFTGGNVVVLGGQTKPTTTATTAANSAPTGSATSQPSSSHSLGSGTIAAITIAVVLALLIFAAFGGFMFWVRRRRQRQHKAQVKAELIGSPVFDYSLHEKHELPPQSASDYSQHTKHELPGQSPTGSLIPGKYELPSKSAVPTVRHELE